MSGPCVLASGLITPLGYNGPATLAALRAGVSAVRALPWRDPATGDPLRGARVSLPHWWFGVGMLADMAAAAIAECLGAAGGDAPQDIPLLLGVSAVVRPGRPAGLDDTLLGEVHARLGLPLHPHSALIPLDQAGCARGLLHATDLLASGAAQRVVVAGVDSYLDAATLNACIERRRLRTATTSNGFFPGEAACAVLLGTVADEGAAHLRILGAGTAREPAPVDSTEPFQGRGSTQACRQALEQAGVTMRDVGWRLTDISGEHYKFKEASFVAGRLDTAPRQGRQELWHPIEYLGEIGAAILPCLLAQALHAGQHGYAPPGLALCHVGSDAGERAAFVVRYDGPIPIPYPNFSRASNTDGGTRTVQIGGGEVGIKDVSTYKKSTGDEAATKSQGMGLVTHKIQSTTYFAAWSFDVKFEGKNAVRHLDLTTHNHA